MKRLCCLLLALALLLPAAALAAEHPDYYAGEVRDASGNVTMYIVEDLKDQAPDYAAVPGEMQAVAAEFGKTRLCEVPVEQFAERVVELREKLGEQDKDGFSVEDFGLPLNLMLSCAAKIVEDDFAKALAVCADEQA